MLCIKDRSIGNDDDTDDDGDDKEAFGMEE